MINKDFSIEQPSLVTQVLRVLFLCLVTCLLSSLSINAATIRYVTQNGAGSFSGLSWANAYAGTQLQDAINASASGDQVWVAAGTFYPTKDITGAVPALYRNKTFTIKSAIKVYGGFTSTETGTT